MFLLSTRPIQPPLFTISLQPSQDFMCESLGPGDGPQAQPGAMQGPLMDSRI